MVLSLSEPYPSPATDVVTIAFTLPEDGSVELAVYDLSGRRVATLVEGDLTAGRHEATWNCGEVPSGVYLYRLETATGTLSRRTVVAR
jgi:flagellar hook assembly protein FlgD